MENQRSFMSSSEHSVPPSLVPPSTNNQHISLSKDMEDFSLTLAAGTALPASPPIDLHVESNKKDIPAPLTLSPSLKGPFRRTSGSSSAGRNERSATPTLIKRTSLSSLQGVNSVTPPRSPVFRRTSSNIVTSTNSSPRPILQPPSKELTEPPMTSATVAQKYFQKELEIAHGKNGVATKYGMVVILQDHCYGHRFSRPRTSRATLNTIVERPERVHASILGLATAYVRLGGRHVGGSAPPDLKQESSAFPSIPFKILKTNRTVSLKSQTATAVHGVKWMGELVAMCESAETNLALGGKELMRPTTLENASHNINSKNGIPKLHEGDLYLCAESLSALEGALGGVCEGVDAAFGENGPKRAFVCVRPPGHHCSADYPSGFCWLNNVHVGISHASLTHGLTHAAIIDFDLHHGDGSQSIAWEHNSRIASLPKNTPQSKKTAIGYFSLHDINSYPCEMGDEEKVRNASMCLENAHGQSIWNVHLQPWKTDAEFWELYQDRYMIILAKARAFLKFHTDRLRLSPTHPQPRGAIFLSAGFDASEWESPGMQRHQVNVPTDFYARFTRDVVKLAGEEATGVGGRVISILEGGYSDRALISGVLSHVSGLAQVSEPTKPAGLKNGLGVEMGKRLGRLNLNNGDAQGAKEDEISEAEIFDPGWWSLSRLEEIENLAKPPTSVAPKRPRGVNQPTYTSVTQSYTAKIVSPPQSRRSLSGSSTNIRSSLSPDSRPQSPLSPPVDWATAAHELSKLLIPSDRQTQSCKPEELNAEASRARRDRHSNIGLPTDVSSSEIKTQASEGKMQLRDRRNKVAKYALEEEEKPISRSNRRKTSADIAILNQKLQDPSLLDTQLNKEKPAKQMRRRLSVASSAESTYTEITSNTSLASPIEILPQRGPLIVKKARTPVNPPSEISKARLMKKTPSVPRVPSSHSSSLKAQVDPKISSASNPDQLSPPTIEDKKPSDIETLTNRMTKMSIKLNVRPKQEQDARDAKTKSQARGRPKSTAPKPKKNPEAGDINVEKDARNNVVSDTYSPVKVYNNTTKLSTNLANIDRHLLLGANTSIAQDSIYADPIQMLSSETSKIELSSLDQSSQPELPPSPELQQPINPHIPAFLPPAPTIPAYDSSITQPNFPLPTVPQQTETLPNLPPIMPITPHSPPLLSPKRINHYLPVFTSTSSIPFGTPGTQTFSIEHTVNSQNADKPFHQSRPAIPDPIIDTRLSHSVTNSEQQPISTVSTILKSTTETEKKESDPGNYI